jgi:uncharacterized protein
MRSRLGARVEKPPALLRSHLKEVIMSTTAQNPKDKIATLLAPMLRQRLFVALSTARASAEQMLPHVAEHLEYMNSLEEKGVLFASGPFVQPGVLVGDGLTILQTDTFEEARALMENEPLIRLGFRAFDLRPWELREGQISVTLNFSKSNFSLEKPHESRQIPRDAVQQIDLP